MYYHWRRKPGRHHLVLQYDRMDPMGERISRGLASTPDWQGLTQVDLAKRLLAMVQEAISKDPELGAALLGHHPTTDWQCALNEAQQLLAAPAGGGQLRGSAARSPTPNLVPNFQTPASLHLSSSPPSPLAPSTPSPSFFSTPTILCSTGLQSGGLMGPAQGGKLRPTALASRA